MLAPGHLTKFSNQNRPDSVSVGTVPLLMLIVYRNRPDVKSSKMCLFRSRLQPQNAVIGLHVALPTGEIVEGALGYIDQHAADESGSFARALYGILDAAFPFQHRPAVKAVLRQFGEDALEIDLPVARTAETSGAILPVLVAAVDARTRRRMVFGVFDVEGFNVIFVDIQVADIVQALQHEMRRVVQDVGARVVARRRQ